MSRSSPFPPADPTVFDIDAAVSDGFALIDRREAQAAEAVFRQVIEHSVLEPRAWLGLGNAWVLQDRPAEAIVMFRQALALAPQYPEARANLGMALNLTGQFEEAAAILAELTAERPASFEAAVNHALTAKRLGQWPAALASFERASALRPDDLALRYEIGLLRLGLGQLRAGWRDYEHRWIGNGMAAPLLPGVPVWQGEDLAGKTILILPEQGLGDMIQFIRYALMLKDKGARVLLACQKPLVRLLRSVSALDHVTDDGATLPGFDYQVMLMSLPWRLGTDSGSVPAPIPYLAAEAGSVAAWQARLGQKPGLKIGLVWAGGPHSDDRVAAAVDHRRSLSLDRFGSLLALPNTHFVSLQLAPAEADRARFAALGIDDAMAEVNDFADTAAIVAALDLVITVDTAVAHLAGAMGKPVWVLSRLDGCWRWLNEGDTSAWYPTLRLFRQSRRDDWSEALDALHTALARKARGHRKSL